MAKAHVDEAHRTALQKLSPLAVLDEAKGQKTVPQQRVSKRFGKELESWMLAAEAELTTNFINMNAVRVASAEEEACYGRLLSMLCVWTQGGYMSKCRA